MSETIIRTAADLNRAFAPKPEFYVRQEVWLAGIAGEMEKQYNKNRDEAWPEIRCVVQESRKLDSGYWSVPSLDVLLNNTAVRGIYLRFEAERGGSTYRPRATGRMRCTVGDYGDRQSFPTKKDGTFSSDKIAQKLLHRVWAAIREVELNNQKKSNAQAVAELRAKHEIKEYDDETVCASYYHRDTWGKTSREMVAPEGKVFVKVGTKTLTPEQADKLLSFLKTL